MAIGGQQSFLGQLRPLGGLGQTPALPQQQQPVSFRPTLGGPIFTPEGTPTAGPPDPFVFPTPLDPNQPISGQQALQNLGIPGVRESELTGSELFGVSREANILPPTTIEELIAQRSPEALRLLGIGTQQAVDLTGIATQQAVGSLQRFAGQEAFDEQAALLGALGPEAQERAIMGIPVSEAQRFAEQQQQTGLRRQAAARGELGGGATLAGLQQLGGQQQAGRISGRLQALDPLSQIARTTASTISGLQEAGGTRQAQLLAGRGPQEASILLGAAAPITAARQTAAELSGLQSIARAQQQNQLLQQFAGLAGRTNLFGLANQPTQSPFVTQTNPLGLTAGQGL